MLPYLMIVFVLALTVYGQLIIKARTAVHAPILAGGANYPAYLFAMFTDVGVLSAFVAGALAGACWMVAVQRLDLSYAYPFVALTFVLVPAASVLLFHESISLPQMLGLALIVIGVSITALTR